MKARWQSDCIFMTSSGAGGGHGHVVAVVGEGLGAIRCAFLLLIGRQLRMTGKPILMSSQRRFVVRPAVTWSISLRQGGRHDCRVPDGGAHRRGRRGDDRAGAPRLAAEGAPMRTRARHRGKRMGDGAAGGWAPPYRVARRARVLHRRDAIDARLRRLAAVERQRGRRLRALARMVEKPRRLGNVEAPCR